MSFSDESENLPKQSSGRSRPYGWRVISYSARRPDREADELKTLIQSMEKGRRTPVKQTLDEAYPPEAA